MKRRPRRLNDRLIDGSTLARMILLSTVMVIATIAVYRIALPSGEAYARSMALTTMVFLQLFNVFNSRSAEQSVFGIPFFSNRLVLVTVFASALLHIGALQLPVLQKLLGTVSLDSASMTLAILAGSTILFADEIRKGTLYLLRKWAVAELSRKEEYTGGNERTKSSSH